MSNIKKIASKLESPVGKKASQKVTFEGGTSLNWNLFKPRFFAELKAKQAFDFIDLAIPGAMSEDGTPIEMSLAFTRPCPKGEEVDHVQSLIDQQIGAVNATLQANTDLLNALPAAQLSAAQKGLEVTKLQIKTNDEVVKITNSRSSLQKDLENSIIQFEKREETFNQHKADCIKTFYNMLGAGPLSVAEAYLRDGKPRAAYLALDTHYNAGVGGQEAASLIMTQMLNFPIDLSTASVSEHMTMMEHLAVEFEGGGINPPLPHHFLTHAFLTALNEATTLFEDEVLFIKQNSLPWETAKLKLQEKESKLLVNGGLSNASRKQMNKSRNGSTDKEIHSLICREVRKVLKRPAESVAVAGENPTKKQVPVCTKCGKRGHSTEQCWSDIICTTCNKKGHIPKFCPEVTGKALAASPKKLVKVSDLMSKK